MKRNVVEQTRAQRGGTSQHKQKMRADGTVV